MKEKITSAIIFSLVIIAVTANTVFVQKKLTSIGNSLDNARLPDEIEQTYNIFKKNEMLFGLSVSHEDLTDVSEGFVELISYLEVGDSDSAEVAKNRLKYLIEHLRRLSGVNIESII